MFTPRCCQQEHQLGLKEHHQLVRHRLSQLQAALQQLEAESSAALTQHTADVGAWADELREPRRS